MPPVRPLPLARGDGLRAAYPALRDLLDDRGPLLLPYASGGPPPVTGSASGDRRLGPGVAVATSGSTGSPKRAVLPSAALRASAEATHAALSGPGRWLLALPAHHIAGLQVVLRSLAAGHEPAHVKPGPFTPESFVAALRDAAGGPAVQYASLVPTQLRRLLADSAARSALADLAAVLVGGAACPPDLLRQARDHGIRLVTTYGMSETAGGCVYDGQPLAGVRVRLEPEPTLESTIEPTDEPAVKPAVSGATGRILLSGPMLATGYLHDLITADAATPADAPTSADSPTPTDAATPGNANPEAGAFVALDGQRWFRTDDLGAVDDAGTLHVLGRLDDIIVTGGVKVAPHIVAAAVHRLLPDVEAVVLGVPDPQWGQRVAVVLVADRARRATLLAAWPEAVAALRAHLPGYAMPRRMTTVERLPVRGPGKPDYRALRALFIS